MEKKKKEMNEKKKKEMIKKNRIRKKRKKFSFLELWIEKRGKEVIQANPME